MADHTQLPRSQKIMTMAGTLLGMLLFTWLTLLGLEKFEVKQFERYEAALLGTIFTVLGVLMLVLKHEH